MRQETLAADRHKARVDASHLVQYLAETPRTAAYADGPSSRNRLHDEVEGDFLSMSFSLLLLVLVIMPSRFFDQINSCLRHCGAVAIESSRC